MAFDFEAMILHAMKVETDRIVGEEIEAAAERVRKRLQANAAQIAMSIMKHCEVHQMRDSVVITVKHMDGGSHIKEKGLG